MSATSEEKPEIIKYDLFEHQPESCRQPLPFKEGLGEGYMQRIMFFDPTPVYERLRYNLNPFNRYNWENVQFTNLFPEKKDGFCDCGCGTPIPVGANRWASSICQMFVVCVWNIIGGRQEFVGEVFKLYFGDKLCMKCGERNWVDIDHIHPVSYGGGGCWLSNFQALCKKCHKEKTRKDMGWQKLKTTKDEG